MNDYVKQSIKNYENYLKRYDAQYMRYLDLLILNNISFYTYKN